MTMAAEGADHAIFMGNLRGDVRIGALKQSIIHLLQQISISINKHSIDVHNKSHSVYAFVSLSSEQESELVLDLLNTEHVLKSLDLSGIAHPGRKLKVAPRLDRWQLTGSGKESNQHQRLLGKPQHNLRSSSHGASSHWSDSNSSRNDSHPVHNDNKNVSTVPHLPKMPPPHNTNNPLVDARKTYTVVGKNKSNSGSDHYYVKRENTAPMFESLLKNRQNYCMSDSDADGGNLRSASKTTTPRTDRTSGFFSNGEKGDDELDTEDDIIIPNSKKFKRKTNQRKKRQAAAAAMAAAAGNKLQESGQSFDLTELKKVADRVRSGAEDTNPSNNNDKQPFFHRESYMLDEVLGNESRLLEFKRGQGLYVHRQLADHVAVYTSAFLNTEGGTLLVGVNDDGEVKGVDIDRHLEDRLRLAIDSTMNRITPSVFPNMYKVEFMPVTDTRKQPLADRKVIEIGVLPGTSGQLYQTPAGDVYVRRDGSVQGPLRANDIQEWTRMMMYEEQRKKDYEIDNLREKEKQLMAELEERKAKDEKCEEASSAPSTPEKRKSKSKVCVIV